jgi:hypothetical protein
MGAARRRHFFIKRLHMYPCMTRRIFIPIVFNICTCFSYYIVCGSTTVSPLELFNTALRLGQATLRIKKTMRNKDSGMLFPSRLKLWKKILSLLTDLFAQKILLILIGKLRYDH